MNRASRYSANVTFLAFVRVVIVAFCVCICHQARVSDGKVFERCELAQVLRYGHGLDVNDVANWVCIAQHSSSLNTSAFGGNARSGGSHGLFQISDQYWCSPPGKGVACGVTCDRLRDDDISDDLACVQIIYEEHQRLSGDGYNAWIAYEPFCKENPYEYVEDCFGNEEQEYLHSKSVAANVVDDEEEEDDSAVYSRRRGKVYGRCELAKELFLKHKMPMGEIPTWVCIAQHESNYDTSAVGRLNADGSADHGLFQISDLYWCNHKGGRKKACGMPCSKLLDADITDDVKCVKQIYKEHTRISGDGFTAWTVYNAYCNGKTAAYVRGCFDGIDVEKEQRKHAEEYRKEPSPAKTKSHKPHGKVYEPCELAEELRSRHHIPEEDIATWVCIAKHESNYNTSAIGYGDHGLFQISDIYWCSPPGKGWACGLSCADLEDSDISDDVECMRKIHREHTRLTGDGFNAWTVYPRFCSKGRSAKYIAHCPGQHAVIAEQSQSYTRISSPNSISEYVPKKGKIYGRCELAKELLERHNMDMEEIPTWVCIAHHESNFDTSAVGRLNADGSADHGLFQISDLFWCSHKEGHRKACGLPCSKLLDSDISDDVRCVKQIHDEHTRISGDGFTAWTVYNPYCRERTEQYIRGCFDDSAEDEDFAPTERSVSVFVSKNKPKGKVYEECELANELRDKHHIPRDQIATWVCIAQHQSALNTSSSISNVHGLFHISDEFWCSPPGKGEACGLNCADLEDSDISDDVECIQKIYEEHQRIFGDGFNAWVTYKQYCDHGRANEYIGHCSGFKSTTANTISYVNQGGVIKTHPKLGGRVIQVANAPVYNHAFQANPFLKHFEVANSQVVVPTFTQPAVKKETYNHAFNANPFLKHFETATANAISPSYTQQPTNKPTFNHEFNVNPFLKHFNTKSTPDAYAASASEEVIDSIPFSSKTQQPAANSFSFNPFLRTISTGSVTTSTPAPAFAGFSIKPTRTSSRKIGQTTYLPQNEEKAKQEAFRSLASPYESISTQTPRVNRLQTYTSNPFRAANTPTAAPTPLPWYQLNTLNSAKSIVHTQATSGYSVKGDPSSSIAKPLSVESFSTTKPQISLTTTTTKAFPVVSFNTVKPTGGNAASVSRTAVQSSTQTTTLRPLTPQRTVGTSFSQIQTAKVVPSTQTTTLRPLTPQRTVGTSFSQIQTAKVVPSTQTTTLRPLTAQRTVGTSFSQIQTSKVVPTTQTTTPRPPQKTLGTSFSQIQTSTSNTAKTSTAGGFSYNRATALPTIQTTTTRLLSSASITTKAPQTSQKEGTGRYDPGRYDAGRYDPGRYDSGRYDSGRYDAGKYNPQPASRPAAIVSTTPTPNLLSRDQSTNRITTTTLRPSSPSSPVVSLSLPAIQPQNSRFLSKYLSSEQDDYFQTSSELGSSSISTSIPGIKITNSGNVGISDHQRTSETQKLGQSVASDNTETFETIKASSADGPSLENLTPGSEFPAASEKIALVPSATSSDSSDTSLRTEFTDPAESKTSLSSTSARETSSSMDLNITPTLVDPSQVPISSAAMDNDSVSSESESAVVPAEPAEQEHSSQQTSEAQSVKQPSSSITLKPIPKSSSAFTAGSARSPVALSPTATAPKLTTSQTQASKSSLRQTQTLTPTRSLPTATAQTFTRSTISPATPTKSATTTRYPSSKPTATTTTKSSSIFGAIKTAPTSLARPAPTPTLKKSAITSVHSTTKPTVFSNPRLPSATTSKPFQYLPTAVKSSASTSLTSVQRSTKSSLTATKETSRPSLTQPPPSRSSRSTRSIITSPSSTKVASANSIIVTKPISRTAPLKTAVNIKTSSPRQPPRTSSAPSITPTKSSRPSGSLFSSKLNIYDLYFKLYGSYPPSKSTSVQPATKTRQANVIAVTSTRSS